MTEVGGSMPVEVEIVVGCVEPRLGRGAMAQRVGQRRGVEGTGAATVILVERAARTVIRRRQ
jgi:hypothetical protein